MSFDNDEEENPVKEEYSDSLVGGLRQGQDSMTWINGDKYDGEWVDGKMHGQGIMTYANGDEYDGEWVDGERCQGTMAYENGDEYNGEWEDGKKHGWGTMTYEDGDKYEGEWVNGEYCGQGTMTYADGEKCEGEFKDGKKHGPVTMTFASVNEYESEWKDDTLTSKSKLVPQTIEYEETVKQDVIEVHVLDPKGNYTTQWKIGEEVSVELVDKFKNPATNELYVLTVYEAGKPQMHIIFYTKWQEIKRMWEQSITGGIHGTGMESNSKKAAKANHVLNKKEIYLWGTLLALVKEQLEAINKVTSGSIGFWGKGRIKSRNKAMEKLLKKLIAHKISRFGEEAVGELLKDIAFIHQDRKVWGEVNSSHLNYVRKVLDI